MWTFPKNIVRILFPKKLRICNFVMMPAQSIFMGNVKLYFFKKFFVFCFRMLECYIVVDNNFDCMSMEF